ncbi:MAG: patatin-like phospholipase family protein [Acidobacteriota bacterium]
MRKTGLTSCTTPTVAAVAAVLLLSLSSGDGLAQKRPGRPKIALVLGGGQAIGFAHVGVLRWLEEHRIPVNAVAGTSMGAYVGALYAMGYSATEMSVVLDRVDWGQTLFQGEIPYQEKWKGKSNDRKREALISLVPGVNLEAFVPFKAAGLAIFSRLPRIADIYGSLRSFDDLPTPFRCVATDLVRGQEVVLESGSLTLALTAALSVPGYAEPVRIDERLLVEGGLVNNLPVNVGLASGADYVIAVVLSSLPPLRTELDTYSGQAMRSIEILRDLNQLRSISKADVLIAPDFANFTETDFNRIKELIDRGYSATAKQAAVLMKFSAGEDEWITYVKARQAKRRSSR